MFPRVVRAVLLGGHADPVDAQEAAVDDDVGLAAGDLDRLGEGGGHGGEQVECLAQVAVDGGRADVESGREVGVGLTFAQVGQDAGPVSSRRRSMRSWRTRASRWSRSRRGVHVRTALPNALC